MTSRFSFLEATAFNARYGQRQQGAAGALPGAVAKAEDGCEKQQPQPDEPAYGITESKEDNMQLGRVAASIPNNRNLAALAEPDLESYTIRLPA